MTLYIRDDTPAMVTVADDRTGHAVASFYYQAGADCVPRMDARYVAEQFIIAHAYSELAGTDDQKTRAF